MKIAIATPWRAQPGRVEALQYVEAWYSRHFPANTLLRVDTPDDPFNPAAARNRAMLLAEERLDADVVILTDADTVPQIEPLWEAIEAAADDEFVHTPFTEYRYLREEISDLYPLHEHTHRVVPGAMSGVYVTTPAVWKSVGGMDERFKGWGFEDTAWGLAHEALLGRPPVRHEGCVYALRHPVSPKRTPQQRLNKGLYRRYLDAAESDDPKTEMTTIVREHTALW